MKEGEIREGRLLFYPIKEWFKRLFNLKFRYKCIECGKGHDGRVVHLQGFGFSNLADFCSPRCFEKYFHKHGYSFRKRITDEKDFCVVCGKKHNNRFVNTKKRCLTHSFCSKECLGKAKKVLKPKILPKYWKGISDFIDLFKKRKTMKDLKKTEGGDFESLTLELKSIIKK